MAYYAVQTFKPSRLEHGVLVLPPLLITIAFCYAFVLMQPHATRNQLATASQSVGLTHIDDGLPSLSIVAPSSLPTLTTIEQDMPVGAKPADIMTGTPQPSTSGVTTLQGAVAGTGQSITVQSTSTPRHKASPLKARTTVTSGSSTASPKFLHSLFQKL